MDPLTSPTSVENASEDNSLVNRFLFDRTVCSWCNLSPPRCQTLKRCHGCRIVVYCGRDCQAAAWPTHRALCRSRHYEPAQVRQTTESSGYATQIALAQAIKEWCGIHEFAFMVLVHSLLRSVSGVEANIRLGRVIVFVLSSRCSEASDSLANEDPARAFTIRGAKLIEGEHAQRFKTGGIPEGPQMAGFWAHSAGTSRADFLPVVCITEDSNFAVTAQYPVFPAFHHPDDTPPGEQMITVFRDLNRVFVNFVNNGVVLQPPIVGRTTTPHSGYMVRKRKGWKWQQDQRVWQYTDAVLPNHIHSLETTSSATDLWTRFWQW